MYLDCPYGKMSELLQFGLSVPPDPNNDETVFPEDRNERLDLYDNCNLENENENSTYFTVIKEEFQKQCMDLPYCIFNISYANLSNSNTSCLEEVDRRHKSKGKDVANIFVKA